MDRQKLRDARTWIREELERSANFWLEHGRRQPAGAEEVSPTDPPAGRGRMAAPCPYPAPAGTAASRMAASCRSSFWSALDTRM